MPISYDGWSVGRPLFQAFAYDAGQFGIGLLVQEYVEGKYYVWGVNESGAQMAFLDVPEDAIESLSSAFLSDVEARLSPLYGGLGDEGYNAYNGGSPVIYNF